MRQNHTVQYSAGKLPRWPFIGQVWLQHARLDRQERTVPVKSNAGAPQLKSVPQVSQCLLQVPTVEAP
jgi:hypothetical protein